MWRGSLSRWSIAATLLGAAMLGTAVAQTGPVDHGAHHPGAPAPAGGVTPPAAPGSDIMPAPSMPGATPAAQPAAGCGGMMGCMGGGPRPFYAALLDMPALTPEARRFIEAEAERRIGWGSQAIAAGHAQLTQALATNDPEAAQRATTEVRQGVLRLESGTAALQAIAAGTPPRQFAQAWFREQLSVSSPEAAPMVMEGGPWGLSWYHLTTMAFLVAFLLGALMIQYARMRRIGGLVERLTPGGAPGAAVPKRDDATPPGAFALDKGVAEQPSAPAAKPAAAAPGAPASAKKPWSGKLRVAAIFRETDTVKTFRLMNPEGGDIPFTFLAGQFITLAAEIDGKPVRRSYTIASSACQRSYVEIAIKREDHGAESRHLHDQVAVGDQLQVSGPSGAFTFTGEEADSIVLISGGIGITPMMCVVRCLNDKSYPGEIFFLHGARTVDDFVFREELGYLQKRHPNLHVVATMGKVSATPWDGAQGPVSKKFIAQAVPDIARRRAHICGPPAMMEAVKTSLLELGVAQNKIKTEAFGAAQGRVPPSPEAAAGAPPEPVPGDAPVGPAPAAPPSAAAHIEFTTSGKTAPLAPDQTVLEAAEAIGVEIDYACRVGTCGTCVVPLKSGEVTMAVEDGLPADEKAKGIILACQAKSIGNLVVEA